LVDRHALNRLAVDLGDDVVGQDTSSSGGRVVDRGHDLDEALLHRDLDAKPAELAVGFGLHLLELVRAHIGRVRVKRGEHAVDGALDQFLLAGALDIVCAQLLEYVTEKAELPVCLGRSGRGMREDLGL
jgi:hypothetical protein